METTTLAKMDDIEQTAVARHHPAKSLEFDCPACLRGLSVPESMVGVEGHCPACANEIIAPIPATGTKARLAIGELEELVGETLALSPYEPLSDALQCTSCGCRLKLKPSMDSVSGGACPNCISWVVNYLAHPSPPGLEDTEPEIEIDVEIELESTDSVDPLWRRVTTTTVSRSRQDAREALACLQRHSKLVWKDGIIQHIPELGRPHVQENETALSSSDLYSDLKRLTRPSSSTTTLALLGVDTHQANVLRKYSEEFENEQLIRLKPKGDARKVHDGGRFLIFLTTAVLIISLVRFFQLD